jgi:succinyl-CoA synthetase beta subunit
VLRTTDQIEPIVARFGPRVVVKAQVRQDGRGRAGGVVAADTPAEARQAVERLLGRPFRGELVKSVLIEERLEVAGELYVGVATDREHGCPAVVVGAEGGVEIEQAAAERPETVARAPVDVAFGLGDYQARYLVWKAGVPDRIAPGVVRAVKDLYRLYRRSDAVFVEVNPLVVTTDGELVAADARLEVDDAALFRQPRFADLRELTPLEAKVERAGFHYVETDGDVGIISTGSGACMAVMDLLAAAGARPANFMELGQSMGLGGAEVATEILLARPDLRAILVAGYSAGALDRLVAGVLDMLDKSRARDIPVVISLEGRNDEQAMAAAAASADPRVRAVPGIPEAVHVVAALARDAG